MTTAQPLRVAVLGAGAVGCYYGGMLARAGVAVTLIGRATHVEAIRRDGLVIAWADRRETIRVGASTDVAIVGDAQIVLVCVKSPDTDAAARSLSPHLAADAVVVSLQNGVDNAERLRAVLSQPVFAAVVYVGAYMDGPGIVRHTGRGDLVLGASRADAARPGIAPRLAAVAALFEAAGIALPAVGRHRCGAVDQAGDQLRVQRGLGTRPRPLRAHGAGAGDTRTDGGHGARVGRGGAGRRRARSTSAS